MTMPPFRNKNILITGASSGIGRAIAERFARAEARVIAIARRSERLQELQELFPKHVYPVTIDVRDRKGLVSCISDLPSQYWRIDILINNAGMGRGGDSMHDGNPEDWDEMIDTNIRGVLHAIHIVLPAMVKAKSGQIINMGSIAANYAYPTSNIYGATKAFLRRLSLNLRTDLAGTGVRVTDIEPGVVETEFTANRLRGDEAAAKSLYSSFRALQPQDIARVVEFVTSTPQHVNIDTIEVMPTDQTATGFTLGTTTYDG